MYNKEIDKKWQNKWQDKNFFKAKDNKEQKKFYGLVEFPYPSGSGLHLGHVKAYIGMDVIARKKRLEGYNVLFPIGWDAFGLPTENYAIKTGIHPREVTDTNIKKFTEQAKSIGFSFDFDRQVDTTDPSYYKWTQWIFLKLFEHGLAYKDETEVNYCNGCQVVLSNEESQGGKCDRCNGEIIQKTKEVWMLKITDYAEKLLQGLEEVDFPESVKLQQQNWIGKSKGAEVDFKLVAGKKETDENLTVYTTRLDTIFGVTFMVIAPEHPLIEKYKDSILNVEELIEYKNSAKKKTEFERVQLAKDKTGVEVKGITVINPFTNKELPVWVSDYVMMGYGTGAIMAVPAHDTRDFEFAKKFGIEIVQVITDGKTTVTEEPYIEITEGTMINSDFLNGKPVKEAIETALDYATTNKIGTPKTNYYMKDWAFARQRYWGEPLPITKCEKCGLVPLKYEDLPLVLPNLKDFKPGEGGESPLAKAEEWIKTTCPKCGIPAERETDTMPQWAGSSWYFLRYIDPRNDNEIASKENLKYWLPVDWYNGGTEHVTRHLIYSRFWHRFLYDIGIVTTKEPYAKRSAQGLILGTDGEKMSKSRGNVIDPQDVINEYGADTLRTYMLFIGDYADAAPWNENGIKGAKKFLDRVVRLENIMVEDYQKEDNELEEEINRTIKKVTEDYEAMKYNTAIAQMMTCINLVYKKGVISRKHLEQFLTILSPTAPHVAEEVWSKINSTYIEETTWPMFDESKIIKDEIEMPVQVNGVFKFKISIDSNASKEDIEKIVMENENLEKYIDKNKIKKVIVVPGRIINFVV
ncbi:MAG: leucine--tRNA ligase [Clostridia bacterium]|nr:leucine--tRNA ligase [Clostridia bacterium]MDD4375625.1 leucine--tRNA ligase [Clostridia bacterium]